MNEQRIQELANDKAFVEMVLALETPEEVQAAFEEKDVELSIAEIQKVYEVLSKHEGEELTEEDLENVAGGELFVVFMVCLLTGIGLAGGTAGGYFGTNAILKRRRW